MATAGGPSQSNFGPLCEFTTGTMIAKPTKTAQCFTFKCDVNNPVIVTFPNNQCCCSI